MIGKTIVVKGELRSQEDLTIEGRVEGDVTCEECQVTIATSGDVHGDVVARDVTVFGRVHGQLVATEVVDVRVDADVRASVIAPKFILEAGATFQGRVEPQHLEAALRVARFNQKKRDEAAKA